MPVTTQWTWRSVGSVHYPLCKANCRGHHVKTAQHFTPGREEMGILYSMLGEGPGHVAQ